VRFVTQQVADRGPFSGGVFAFGRSSWPRDLICGARPERPRVCGSRGRVVGSNPDRHSCFFQRKRGRPDAAAGYLAPLRQALIDRNHGHVNVVVCESDYRALKRGIEQLGPGVQ
jgi:hypothetical protein